MWQGCIAAVTYSSRIPLAPQGQGTHTGVKIPVVLSWCAWHPHLHVGSAPLAGEVWGARVPPLLPPSPPPPAAGWREQPFVGAPKMSAGLSGSLHLLPLLLASLQHQGCLLQSQFAFSSVNKQSHPEFERKGCIFVPLKRQLTMKLQWPVSSQSEGSQEITSLKNKGPALPA